MKRKLMCLSIIISISIVLLLLPLVFKAKSRPALVGPNLSELEYSEIFFENSYENLQLSGILILPEGEGPFPTAGFDPIPYWKDVHVPVFFALGGNDENVPVDASIHRLKENNLNHFAMKIYPDGGHAIRDIQTNRLNEEYLHDLVKFIQEVKR